VSYLERRKEVASGRRGSVCGYAIKGTAKGVEKKSGACPMMESTGALWRGHSRWDMSAGTGVVYKGGSSTVCEV